MISSANLIYLPIQMSTFQHFWKIFQDLSFLAMLLITFAQKRHPYRNRWDVFCLHSHLYLASLIEIIIHFQLESQIWPHCWTLVVFFFFLIEFFYLFKFLIFSQCHKTTFCEIVFLDFSSQRDFQASVQEQAWDFNPRVFHQIKLTISMITLFTLQYCSLHFSSSFSAL